jgi:hypothetical protein
MPSAEMRDAKVDETKASHRHAKEVCGHFSYTVEGRFRRCVEDLVSPERVQAPSFLLEEHVFIESTPAQLQTLAVGWLRIVILTILRAFSRCLLSFRMYVLSTTPSTPRHPTEDVLLRPKRKWQFIVSYRYQWVGRAEA